MTAIEWKKPRLKISNATYRNAYNIQSFYLEDTNWNQKEVCNWSWYSDFHILSEEAELRGDEWTKIAIKSAGKYSSNNWSSRLEITATIEYWYIHWEIDTSVFKKLLPKTVEDLGEIWTVISFWRLSDWTWWDWN